MYRINVFLSILSQKSTTSTCRAKYRTLIKWLLQKVHKDYNLFKAHVQFTDEHLKIYANIIVQEIHLLMNWLQLALTDPFPWEFYSVFVKKYWLKCILFLISLQMVTFECCLFFWPFFNWWCFQLSCVICSTQNWIKHSNFCLKIKKNCCSFFYLSIKWLYLLQIIDTLNEIEIKMYID